MHPSLHTASVVVSVLDSRGGIHNEVGRSNRNLFVGYEGETLELPTDRSGAGS